MDVVHVLRDLVIVCAIALTVYALVYVLFKISSG
jgi:hypothetical protein